MMATEMSCYCLRYPCFCISRLTWAVCAHLAILLLAIMNSKLNRISLRRFRCFLTAGSRQVIATEISCYCKPSLLHLQVKVNSWERERDFCSEKEITKAVTGSVLVVLVVPSFVFPLAVPDQVWTNVRPVYIYLGECMVSIIYIKNGIKEPTRLVSNL